MTVLLSAIAKTVIETAARRALPKECCGLLVGHENTISRAVEAPNLARDPDRFELDARVHLGLQRDLRGTGEQIVGVFHSHPYGQPVPSAEDFAQASYLGWIWLITALDDKGCTSRAWRAEDTGFVPMALRYVD
ncbi:Mov34/MPN/PAD-1 [Iodidimonas muriae]|uniref:Mov34/MPN/PAD-1 n=1 Tax=Iodidimonas muriae TaxID=261467 RepID=A0ABQ2LDW8_9PROT|nr:Mov34/MPN/PAD-1 [Kordiimonadales bacterium JCM 17843]GGO12711.1 Mov34/MPN/PAD-1 [Iodidimonas muriae]